MLRRIDVSLARTLDPGPAQSAPCGGAQAKPRFRSITTRAGRLATALPMGALRCPASNGSRSRPTPPGFGQIVLCRPDAWVRVSFAHTRVSIVGWIYDPDHSLPPGMYVDVPHLDCLDHSCPPECMWTCRTDCLLVAPPITVEGLDHVILKPKKFDRVVAVNVDGRGFVRSGAHRWTRRRSGRDHKSIRRSRRGWPRMRHDPMRQADIERRLSWSR